MMTAELNFVLTGISSFITGIILVIEWYYLKKRGRSFFASLFNHVDNVKNKKEKDERSCHVDAEHKLRRNPLSMFRGPERKGCLSVSSKVSLTPYDVKLFVQDHLKYFTCKADKGKEEYEIMQAAWKEMNPEVRIRTAHEALKKNPECASAYILLAEEECVNILECKKLFTKALKIAKENCNRSARIQDKGPDQEMLYNRDMNVMLYIRGKLAVCERKLGHTKKASNMMKALLDEFPEMDVFNIHENLIEACLEMQAFGDVHNILVKYDAPNAVKSATVYYTAALLKARKVNSNFSLRVACGKGLRREEVSAVDAIHRAMEFNPHVPQYLLERKSLVMPPEHIVTRGDSEAVAYAYFHLAHWKKFSGALRLLRHMSKETFPKKLLKSEELFEPYPTSITRIDRKLLPVTHEISVHPKMKISFLPLYTVGLCFFATLLALFIQRPDPVVSLFKMVNTWLSFKLSSLWEYMQGALPSSQFHELSHAWTAFLTKMGMT